MSEYSDRELAMLSALRAARLWFTLATADGAFPQTSDDYLNGDGRNDGKSGWHDADALISEIDAAVESATQPSRERDDVLGAFECALAQWRSWAREAGTSIETSHGFGGQLYQQCRAIFAKATGGA